MTGGGRQVRAALGRQGINDTIIQRASVARRNWKGAGRSVGLLFRRAYVRAKTSLARANRQRRVEPKREGGGRVGASFFQLPAFYLAAFFPRCTRARAVPVPSKIRFPLFHVSSNGDVRLEADPNSVKLPFRRVTSARSKSVFVGWWSRGDECQSTSRFVGRRSLDTRSHLQQLRGVWRFFGDRRRHGLFPSATAIGQSFARDNYAFNSVIRVSVLFWTPRLSHLRSPTTFSVFLN